MDTKVVVLMAGNERGGAASHIAILADAVRQRGLTSHFCFGFVGGGPLSERVASLGVQHVVFPGHPVKAVSALRRYIQEHTESSVLFHAHGPRMNVIAYFATQRRIPWVSTVHSDIYNDFLASRMKTLFFTRLNKWCLSHSDGVFVVHPMYAKWFPLTHTFYVPNGISMQPLKADRAVYRAALRDGLQLASDTPIFGIAARFDPVKDISTIIRAIPHMKTSTAHFVLAGDGQQRQELEQLVLDLHLESRVHFLGFIDKVREFYAALDVHVLASQSEGTPFSVLEAGLYEVPNVGTRIPGILRLLEDGETGRTFPVGDERALASILDDLFAHPEQARELALHFSERVLPNYTPEKMLQAYLNGYDVVLGRTPQTDKEREFS